MITMTVIAQVKPEKQQEFLQAVSSLYSDREKEKGLKKTTLYQEMNAPAGFRLIANGRAKRIWKGTYGRKISGCCSAHWEFCAKSRKSGTAPFLRKEPKFGHRRISPQRLPPPVLYDSFRLPVKDRV